MAAAPVERGSAGPILLLHGQPGCGASWDPLSRLLEGRYRVLAPDRIGYGVTAGEGRGLAENAELVAAYLGDQHAGPATVVAHSWSGGVAVLLATRWPDTVSSLVLVGAACTPDSLDPIDRLLVHPGVGDVLTFAGLLAIAEILPRLRGWVRCAPARCRPWLSAVLPDQTALGYEGRLRQLGRLERTFMIEQRALVDEMPTVTAALGDLTLPVAVVAGRWDMVVRPSAAQRLARSIPGSELLLLPRAGHFVARDAPEALAEVVRRYSGQSGPVARSSPE